MKRRSRRELFETRLPQDGQKDHQRGRSERKPEAYSFAYVEGLSDARTKLAVFFTILLNEELRFRFFGELENRGQPHDLVDAGFHRLALHPHVFQAGAAGDQPKFADVLRVLKHL